MQRFTDLVEKCRGAVREVLPWDLCDRLADGDAPLLLDVREPDEFAQMRIAGSRNVPRGILEAACEYGYEDTVPELAAARDQEIVVICRSGLRSVLAAYTLRLLGYEKVCSLKTGLRGWNDFEQALVDDAGMPVEIETADAYFTARLRPEQEVPVPGRQRGTGNAR
ncbi:MAG: sulfurtransferase [Chromatiales bacterium 21-64-14]|nr:MAG: sulfurtransferase [Chromatiales bacterium 21-64-14]HQU16773.1 rhodanese-like domain-containing protein [Gammaproteobacteria bacterium]